MGEVLVWFASILRLRNFSVFLRHGQRDMDLVRRDGERAVGRDSNGSLKGIKLVSRGVSETV